MEPACRANPHALRPQREIVLSSTASDSHTWNLVYLQLVLEELGHHVVNLGACVPNELLVAECEACQPDLVVLSTVNGHGYQDGLRAISALRASPRLAGLPVIIGGKLGTAGVDAERSARLLEAGFDGVFVDEPAGLRAFRAFVAALPVGVLS
ncbi:MAG TPA: cobalamin-dependent protein [Jatrophihabitans sp.]|jgi:methylaspartate mutase sigma subunit|uniref:cobalamin B12-binding domain-containing protein n=1 Tax=Jatrophihabitans sp. TaxID=1932789 RepID=UPI002F20EAD4